MARQVMFDPFGSYTGGYQRGVQQEAGLQEGIRQARDSDYKYYNLNPLELSRLQREDAVGVAAQPYRLQLPALGFQNAQAETFGKRLQAGYGAAQFGLAEPTIQALADYTGMGYTGTNDGFQFQQNGAPVGGNLGIQQVLQGYAPFRQEQYDRSDTGFSQGVQAQQVGIQDFNAQTARAAAEANATIGYQNAESEAARAQARTPGANGLPSFLDFGSGQSPQQAQPQYVQSPRPAQPIPGQTNTSKDLVTWMQATNPYAPAITEADWDAMGPAGQEQYKRNYFPQLINAGYGASATNNPANYNPYASP
jgi:hypothetical protein